jgi:predicted transposase/invertase (TIGR01784 family)
MGENKEEKEGILDIKLILNQNRKINIEMQNTYQDDWTERSLFYNCRMFTDGFQKGHPYGEIPPCIHVGILNFNQMISPNYYHKVSLMDEKTKEVYSRKFQFHMIELKKLENVKEKQKKKPLYRWAKMIAAQTWEELEQESRGNKYMERALEEMIKISQDEKERYLYLREEMAESDRVSQIESAQRLGRKEGKKEGELVKLIMLIQKKMGRGDTKEKIMDDLMEEESLINPIYQLVKENPDKTKEEIYKMLDL